MSSLRLLYDKPQAAEQLSISVRVLADLIASGELESVKVGRRRLIPHDCLQDYIQRLRAAA